MADVEIKRKATIILDFTVRDNDGNLQNVSGGTFTLTVKATEDSESATFTKADADFDHSEAQSGVVSVNLTATDTDRVGRFLAELKMVLGATVAKSENFSMEFMKALSA